MKAVSSLILEAIEIDGDAMHIEMALTKPEIMILLQVVMMGFEI